MRSLTGERGSAPAKTTQPELLSGSILRIDYFAEVLLSIARGWIGAAMGSPAIVLVI